MFFDDILVYLANWTDHLMHLQIVFQILVQHQLFVKLSKCAFGTTKIEYLGHVISKDGVAMDEDKIACIVKWPYP